MRNHNSCSSDAALEPQWLRKMAGGDEDDDDDDNDEDDDDAGVVVLFFCFGDFIVLFVCFVSSCEP